MLIGIHTYVQLYEPNSGPISLRIPYHKQLWQQGEFSHSKVLILIAVQFNFLCCLYRALCVLLPTLERL
jgi:hypothetical protein